jgi:hypothetical protein
MSPEERRAARNARARELYAMRKELNPEKHATRQAAKVAAKSARRDTPEGREAYREYQKKLMADRRAAARQSNAQ